MQNAEYNSSEILSKEKPDYFQGRIRQTPIRDFSKKILNKIKQFFQFAFRGWHKFITIALVLILVLAAIFTAIALISKASNPETGDSTGDSDASSWEETIDHAAYEAYVLSESGSETAFSDAIDYLQEEINSSATETRKFYIRTVLARFYIEHGDTATALVELYDIDDSKLSDSEKLRLYTSFRYAFIVAGDSEQEDVYTQKIDALPADIRNIGGQVDE